MTTPVTIKSQSLIKGESWTPAFLLKVGGVALDLTLATVITTLRIRLVGSSSGEVVRSTAIVGNTAWVTDGTDGQVKFLFDQAATLALAVGSYDLEITYVDTSLTPDIRRIHARGMLVVKASSTGAY